MIVCIPTKGIPQTKTHKIFEECGIKVFHFIEPQEMNSYSHDNKVNIEKNDQGISYVRNYILDWAKENNHKTIMMCDDDITCFHEYIKNKNTPIKSDRLIELSEKFDSMPFELGGFNYKQLIWTAKKSYAINSSTVDQCVMMKPLKIKWRYRPHFNMKEDRDFTLQTIKKGYGVLKFCKVGINSPEIGSNQGGLYNEYKQRKDEEAVSKMCKEWKPFITPKKSKRGVFDCKIDYKGMAKKLGKKVV